MVACYGVQILEAYLGRDVIDLDADRFQQFVELAVGNFESADSLFQLE